jgi:hypothetical protein
MITKKYIFIVFHLMMIHLLFAEVPTKKPICWVDLGLTKLIWQPKYILGINYNLKQNNFIGVQFYQYREPTVGGIIFEDEIPNRVKESTTFMFTYGYHVNPKNTFFKIIPSIGIGSTSGLFRTNNLISNNWSKNYEEIPFSGLSLSPQINFLLHNKWGGLGLVFSLHNTFTNLGNTYSSGDFAFKICFGNMK